MVSRNPSVQASVIDELDYWRRQWKHCDGTKKTKEYILRQIRKCESQLGIEGKDYNSNEFKI